MDQLHRRLTDEQIRVLLKSYCLGKMSRAQVQEMLGVGKTRFFALVRSYRQDPDSFSIAYERSTPARLSAEVEAEIEKALLEEKEIVQDPDLPISGYNYTALRDRLRKKGVDISVTTIIKRAKKLGCHKPRRKRKVHDREVLTASIGALVQHDASLHLWSPLAKEKWTLTPAPNIRCGVTSIDDYSRKILFADFFTRETTWAHIRAAQTLIQSCGLPFAVPWPSPPGQATWTPYVCSVSSREGTASLDCPPRTGWRKHVLETDDVETQWGKMMRILNVDVTYALSPQAKGKVERPYRWLQDRIVRTCVYEKISAIDEVRSVLRDEVNRYNGNQVHSTTGEVPSIRYERARKEGNSLFRKFVLPKPYTSTKDIFCLREKRMVNGYRRISLFKHVIEVPNVPLREDVDVHLVPDEAKQLMHIRIWWNNKMVHSVSLPLLGFRVHF